MDNSRARRTLIVVLALAGILVVGHWVFFSHTPSARAATSSDWLQFAFDEEKTSVNPNETTITPSNVGNLVQTFTISTASQVDGAPVYLSGVVTSSGTRDLLFFSEFHGEIVAADAHNGTVIWSKVLNGCSGCQTNSSPAIDPNRQFIYQYGTDGLIHKLQVADGTEITTGGWPEMALANQSTKSLAALAIATAANGNSYLYASGSSFGSNPFGHVTGINLNDGTQHVFNFMCSNLVDVHIGLNGTTCGSSGAGVWSRGGFAYHPGTDRTYTATAEWGSFSPANHKWSQTLLAMTPIAQADSNGNPLDSYTNSKYAAQIAADEDLGSTQPVAMPDLPGSVPPHIIMQSGKDSVIHLLNAANLTGSGTWGGLDGDVSKTPVPTGGSVFASMGVYKDPATGTIWVICPSTSGLSGLTYALNSSNVPVLTPQWQQSGGASSLAIANGMVFYFANTKLNAADIHTGNLLWSVTSQGRHWSSPIVANGMVYAPEGGSPGTMFAYSLSSLVGVPPGNPAGLAGIAGNGQSLLSWSADTGATSYNVKRSTTNGGPYTTVASAPSNSFDDTGLTNGTTYYYVVTGVNANGESGNSNQASVTPTSTPTIDVNAGGPLVSPFMADQDFTGGGTTNHANTIDLSGVTNPAPMAVYQTGRDGNFTYTIPGFAAGGSELVRLHFAETFFTAKGSRVFNVSINGTQVLTNFDIFAAAGAQNKAIVEEFTVNADSGGKYTIVFTSVVNNSLVSGIEITPASGGGCSGAPSAPSGLGATAASSTQINLSWTASTAPSGCTIAYAVFRSTTSGFTPASSNQIASGVSGTSYSDSSGLSASTTYYYLVEASDSSGTSAPSNQAQATTGAACTAAPAAPTGLTATAASTSQVNLSWTASASPSGCTVTYSVTRNSTQITTGVTGTTFSDTGLACTTTYTYTVAAVDSAGSSGASNSASATTSTCPPPGVQINSGGPAVTPFVADVDFTGGATINHANTIDLTGVTNPAPMAVYQTARVDNFTYTIPGFAAGSSHTVRLHFAETYFGTAGSRTFNVSINGTQVLAAFDIFKTASAKNKAVIEQFTENANSSGQYVIQFTSVVNNSLVSGIEIQ